MKKKLLDIFTAFMNPLSVESTTLSSAIPLERQLQLATCALLLEMSKSDNSVTAEETDAIIKALSTAYKIDTDELAMLKSAAEDELQKSTSLRSFTSLINEHYSTQQKEEIIKLLWIVAHADGKIDKHESHLIRTVADLLYIPREHAMALRND
ncbi:MAG: TerB family tellurite resistance protein [Pseudomonadales bacterium]|nr:TerB family tellurite resistance protein [Pseudomonadales bacterium]